ncbi:MAG: deoxyguanosinetriphosphate triphosphohydrolase [Chloroflexota bacterium]|nr:deoxyguanosinetriphosphate triphosphohydrolase [Chloroflexota bacterium]
MIHSDIRQRLEEREESLSPYATKSRWTRGRVTDETPSAMRTEFQRDRDRITYSKAFRRLKHKTQVFIAPLGDHYVTRLTHTLEVSQIARSIARALNLNEDLAEAISLGHDLGHTPFGHVGEEVLNALCSREFSHNTQSLRIVESLENDGKGLNLTWEVREGILKHSKSRQDILHYSGDVPSTLEAQICRLADSVAYINHDISDAMRAELITESDLPQSAIAVLGESNSARINTMVCDIIDQSWEATGLIDGASPTITMSTEVLRAANSLREFLFQNVYEAQAVESDTERAKQIIQCLYHHFMENPDHLPGEYIAIACNDRERGVVDYIAGMTDNYALRIAEELGMVRPQ